MPPQSTDDEPTTTARSDDTDERTDGGREQIRDAVTEEPWKTHAEVAEDLDVSRSWVSEVVGDNRDLQKIRDAYRKGIDLTADDRSLLRLADIVELHPEGDVDVAKRLRRSADELDVSKIHIELEPPEGE